MIDIENSLLLIIDVQDKLVRMADKTDLQKNIATLSNAANILNVKTIITEQYPRGLGETIKEVKESSPNAQYFEKTSFSALNNKEIEDKIDSCGKKQIIICGIEAHICVLQTAVALKEKGYDVFFVTDCSLSRKISDFNTAIDLLKQYEVKIVSNEIILFSWLKSSKNEHFKEIQGLIK